MAGYGDAGGCLNVDDDDAKRMDPPPKARASLRGDDEGSEERSPGSPGQARPGPEGGRWMNKCVCDELSRLKMDESVTFGRRE